MTVQHKNQDSRRTLINATAVAKFLREHKDFFEEHPDLLQELTVPHPSGGAISLIERQVAVLRDQNKQLRKQLQDLIGIARDNDRLFARLHHLTQSMIEAEGLEQALAAVYDQLREGFGADLVTLRLFAPHQAAVDQRKEFIANDHAGLESVNGMLSRRKPVCGRFNNVQLQFIFGDRADEVKSAALIPLGDERERFGFLAIASFEPSRFKAGMSTVFLTYMGETISNILRRYLG